jgi:parallel beta-helix repeat protein
MRNFNAPKSMNSSALTALGIGFMVAFGSTAYAAGATTTFTSYEAESGVLSGGAQAISLTSSPTTRFSSPALESSGHAYVTLTSNGHAVKWTNKTGRPITFINVRASIPDALTGRGTTATLNLYVDGVFRQAINLNSKQSWQYEGNDHYNGTSQNPVDGSPRVFFDEFSTFISGAPVAPNSTITLKKDAANTAAFYNIDVIDVENPPAAISQPANSISITSCGAVASDVPTNGAADSSAVDSTAAIQNCINQAQSQKKILWIPPGTFYLKGTQGLTANGITIQGAGMWYSKIYRDVPIPYTGGGLAALFEVNSCVVSGLRLDSSASSREPVDGDAGGMDTTGTNWVADGIWTQHVMSGFWASGTGGTLKNNRLTSIWADGFNLNNVALNGSVGNNLTATNNFVRGTGDDAMAINSVAYNESPNGNVYYTAMSNITLKNNTAIALWGGKGIGVYGGDGHLVQDNYISDTARYIGLGLGRFGVNGNDLLSATVTGNVIERAGGNGYDEGQPALHIGNAGDGKRVGVVSNVTVSGNTVMGALYDGVNFSTSTNTTFESNTITAPKRDGIVISTSFYPAPTGSAKISKNTVTQVGAGASPYRNNSTGFTPTLIGNSWQ